MSSRQTDLLAGDDWTSIYRGFTQINFNATDPVSINQALREYIRINYPENFNDWIVSSEFVALTDLLSWLAGTLAYKTDIAARENFIDTAESRESILRLARFLSYNPSRCQPATGVLKLTQVMTNEDVFDSLGNDLANSPVVWNDPNNINWLEQFTLVMNAAFIKTNPFGIPLSSGTVANVATDLYRINGLARASNLSFSATVSGTSMGFEICNGDFSDSGTLFERKPDPANALQLFYLNDKNGYASARTGFFLLFKQGSTAQQVFHIATPVQDQLLDLGVSNVNQDDVWVSTVDDVGQVQIDWTKVPAIFNNNITYNNLANTVRTIYSVLTRDNDQVTIRFSDGSFGLAPVGNIAVTYRVSNGLSYQIQPSEISNITLPIQYFSTTGAPQLIYLTFSLTEPVANAAAAETIEQIRQRAPQVYGTQNRMVSAQDYNTFPLSSNLAVKINAVNRVYSGQSRYIDLHDPTGTYQDLSIFGEDGLFFREAANTYFEVPTNLNRTSLQIFNDYILPAIDQYTTANLIRDVLMQNVLNQTIQAPVDQSAAPFAWVAASTALFNTSGGFVHGSLVSLPASARLIKAGALLQFNVNDALIWVSVVSISGAIDLPLVANTAGPVTLSQSVPTGATLVNVLPQVATALKSSLTTLNAVAVDLRSDYLDLRLSFSLLYDYMTGLWVLGSAQNNFGGPEVTLNGTTLLIGLVNFIGGVWRISTRGLRYVFESLRSVEWYDNGLRTLAQNNGEANADNLRVLRINPNLNDTRGYALGVDYGLTIDRLWTYPDGTAEPRRTTVLFADSNADGVPDRPDMFYKVIASAIDPMSDATLINRYLFWSNTAAPPYEQPYYNMIGYDTNGLLQADTPASGSIGFQVVSTITPLANETFWVYHQTTGWVQDTTNSYRFAIGRGPNVAARWIRAPENNPVVATPAGDALFFHWQHYAPNDHRIDPANTNIIDIFVLTYSYDKAIRQWITTGTDLAQKPYPPTELDLSLAFASLEDFKMFSDTIVWRPVQYKFLFGTAADTALQAKFKVVRALNSAVSDGEIQSNILNAINTFFTVSKWDFGETFYFTELAAYIHQQLVGQILSVVIVPVVANGAFGDGFEIPCEANEIFISVAQVADIVLIASNTATNLRIGT